MHRVHREATECVVFIGRQQNAWEPTGWVGTECVVVFIGRAWTEQAMETRPGVPQNGRNGLVFDRPRSKRDPVHREGSDVPQNGGNGPPTVETGVMLIGSGVVYRTTDETDLLRSKRGSCGSGGCGVPQNRENGLVLERYSRNRGPVHWEGCGIP